MVTSFDIMLDALLAVVDGMRAQSNGLALGPKALVGSCPCRERESRRLGFLFCADRIAGNGESCG